MRLIADECVHCRRPVGYVTPQALQIPTMCILCAADKETLAEWGHTVSRTGKPINDVLIDYRFALNRLAYGKARE